VNRGSRFTLASYSGLGNWTVRSPKRFTMKMAGCVRSHELSEAGPPTLQQQKQQIAILNVITNEIISSYERKGIRQRLQCGGSRVLSSGRTNRTVQRQRDFAMKMALCVRIHDFLRPARLCCSKQNSSQHHQEEQSKDIRKDTRD
jgi:hypothetical protein